MSIFHLGRKNNSDALPGEVSEIAVVRGESAGQIITAVRAASNLKLITWRATASGPITKLADSGNQAGAASHIDIVHGKRIVTAFRTASGDLKLISWDVDPITGSITRAGDSGTQAGTASRIKIAIITNTRFVTAFRSGDGRIKLISWSLNADGSLTRLADSGNAGDPAAEISLLRLAITGGSIHNFVTPIIDPAGNLKVIRWNVSTRGAFTRVSDSGVLASGASSVRVTAATLNRPVVAFWNQVGHAKLIVCRLTSDGGVQRLGDTGTDAGAVPIDSLGGEHNGVVSAGRSPDGTLKLIGWGVDDAGNIVRRTDSGNQEGASSLITLLSDPATTGLSMLTAARTSSGTLKLVGWGQPVVRLHIKVLEPPSRGVDALVAGMAQVYGTVGIRVEHVSTETLNLGEEFRDIEVSSCRKTDLTSEQLELYQNRNNAGPNDVVVYIVRGTNPILVGCAAHPPGRPGAVVAFFANEWTIAHEVGHVLGLNHVADDNRLMLDDGTFNITNPPPDLNASEASTLLSSPYTV